MLKQATAKPKITARENLKWLFILRNLMISGEAVIILLSVYGLKIGLPEEPIWLVITAIAAVNLYTWIRLQNETPITELELFSQLTLDVFGIASLLYLTGGATNPIIWIFLLPLILTAIILPQEYTWYMVILTTALYTLLIAYHRPLPAIEPYPTPHEGMYYNIAERDEHYFNLHIFGMWFGFVLSAALVAYFVVELAKTIQEGERKLSEARENELRNERVIALGTLAASAAHDMGTPLGTIAILTHDALQSYPEHRFPDLHKKLYIMEKQVNRCKQALSLMSASAGELRAESGQIMDLTEYIDEVLNQWRAQKPGIKLNLFIDLQSTLSPRIVADRTLTLGLINILNNAAEISPKERGIDFHMTWNEYEMNIRVRDYGHGLSPEIAALAGKEPVTTKETGLGVGLFLTFSTIRRLGGKIDIYNMDDGGACTEITLPLLTSRNHDDDTGN